MLFYNVAKSAKVCHEASAAAVLHPYICSSGQVIRVPLTLGFTLIDCLQVGVLRQCHDEYNTEHKAPGVDRKRRRAALCTLLGAGLCCEVCTAAIQRTENSVRATTGAVDGGLACPQCLELTCRKKPCWAGLLACWHTHASSAQLVMIVIATTSLSSCASKGI
jgi:hypothetical protein